VKHIPTWAAAALVATGAVAWSQDPPGEKGALDGVTITQAEIASGKTSLKRIRMSGLRVFSTPFNALDGLGDGPVGAVDRTSPGGRPTLGGNGMHLRVNGLDSQSCLDCHAVLSSTTVPASFAPGGAGTVNNNVLAGPKVLDPADLDGDGAAAFDGRFINPPFIYGCGGLELLGKEMTADLQALREIALADPGLLVTLETHGTSFGAIVAAQDGTLDGSRLEGVDADLVVRPFGRKGEFATVREFALGAMQFHFGMQPVEVVGEGVDGDGDGVVDEVTVGQMSALVIWAVALDRPRVTRGGKEAARGRRSFEAIGCADCHVPSIDTRSTTLPLSFPEVPTDASANVFFLCGLSKSATRFRKNAQGGVSIELFADLKRHDMGPGLAETASNATNQRNREFTTARLWGVADSAPYLHDGRATTLTDAILMHGGEAQAARDGFAALTAVARTEVLAFLRTLRTPKNPERSLVRRSKRRE